VEDTEFSSNSELSFLLEDSDSDDPVNLTPDPSMNAIVRFEQEELAQRLRSAETQWKPYTYAQTS
jgi:hypothetical protein